MNARRGAYWLIAALIIAALVLGYTRTVGAQATASHHGDWEQVDIQTNQRVAAKRYTTIGVIPLPAGRQVVGARWNIESNGCSQYLVRWVRQGPGAPDDATGHANFRCTPGQEWMVTMWIGGRTDPRHDSLRFELWIDRRAVVDYVILQTL